MVGGWVESRIETLDMSFGVMAAAGPLVDGAREMPVGVPGAGLDSLLEGSLTSKLFLLAMGVLLALGASAGVSVAAFPCCWANASSIVT